MLLAEKTSPLTTAVIISMKTGSVRLSRTVGLITTLMDMKKIVLNKLPTGVMRRLTPLVPGVLVTKEFTTKVFKVEEKLSRAVNIITLRYRLTEIIIRALLPTSRPVYPKKSGIRHTFRINYKMRKKTKCFTSSSSLTAEILVSVIVTAVNSITTMTLVTLLTTSILKMTLAKCRVWSPKLLKVPTTTAAEDTESTLFKKRSLTRP